MSDLYWRAYKVANYRLRHLLGGRFAMACHPVSILLLITGRCNSRCVHCDIWRRPGPEDALTFEEWKTVLGGLARWLGPVAVTLSGGEALLRDDTPELAACGRSYGLLIEVLTHGYWTDQRRIEQLAMANPRRITVSVDAIGETHSRIRGREDFWERTHSSLQTLRRLQAERNLGYGIRLKTVVMEQNVDQLAAVARFGFENQMEVFYQPIEQNYDALPDSSWFERSPNWPRHPGNAVRRVEELMQLKRDGLPIANSFSQLAAMIPYFQDPRPTQASVRSHSGHERRPSCCALTTIQVNPNGDFLTCCSMPPVGNVKAGPVHEIWRNRPRWWEGGCCQGRARKNNESAEAQTGGAK